MRGGNGADRLNLVDGERDVRADCGPTRTRADQDNPDPGDEAALDLRDAGDDPPTTSIPTTGCETVTFAAVQEGPNARISGRTVRLTRRGVARIRISCPRSLPSACSGRLALQTLRGVRLGDARYTVAAGASKAVAVRLTQRGRRIVRRERRLPIRATARARGGFGPKTTIQELTIRAS